MYIQITTRCNMGCRHCCMSATRRGKDMSMAVFQKAVGLAVEFGESVSLGGGEPTVHPEFAKMLFHAIGKIPESEVSLWMATNGKRTEIALALAAMARSGLLGVALSQDQYHDPIDPRVVRAFQDGRRKSTDYGLGSERSNDCREIRNVSNRLIRVGRAASVLHTGNPDDCACAELFVKPNGDIHWCGCPDAPRIGTVLKGSRRVLRAYAESGHQGECWRKSESRLLRQAV